MRCSLAWERASGTCNPPMWVVRVCGGYGGARSEGDGSAVVEIRRRRALVPRRWPTALGSSTKGQGGGTGPYRRLEVAWVAAQTVGDEVWRRRWAELAVRARGWSSGLRIPSGRCVVVLQRWKEVRGTGAGPAARNFGEEQLTSGGLRVKIRRGHGLDRGERAQESSLGARRCSCEDLPGWRDSGVA